MHDRQSPVMSLAALRAASLWPAEEGSTALLLRLARTRSFCLSPRVTLTLAQLCPPESHRRHVPLTR